MAAKRPLFCDASALRFEMVLHGCYTMAQRLCCTFLVPSTVLTQAGSRVAELMETVKNTSWLYLEGVKVGVLELKAEINRLFLELAQIRLAFPGYGVVQVVGKDAVAVLQPEAGDGRLPPGFQGLEIRSLDDGHPDPSLSSW